MIYLPGHDRYTYGEADVAVCEDKTSIHDANGLGSLAWEDDVQYSDVGMPVIDAAGTDSTQHT